VASGWTGSAGAAVWAVCEVGGGEDWRGGGEADVQLATESGATLAAAHAAVEPGTRSVRVKLTPATALLPGEYVVRVRGRSVSPVAVPVNEVAHVTVLTAPAASGALLIRRGASTANKEVPTADVRFR